MNVTTARTFLAILETGNLNKAAEHLHVTQSTVTMRINKLEEQLGRQLLVRNKNGVELTNAGFKFQRYAEMTVQAWQQAKQEIALPKNFDAAFTLGIEPDLWYGATQDWLIWSRAHHPEIALSVWSADGATLSRWLNSNLVDAALHFGPIPGSGFESDPLFEERLVLVSSEDRPLQRWDSNYIYVDWGERFRRDHALAYPVTETAAVTFGEGTLALSYLLQQGGSGYFPFRMVQNHLDKQTLFLVPKAPEFTRQVMLSRSPLFPPYDWYEAFRNHFMERGQGTIDP